jgi:hypothetical protein
LRIASAILLFGGGSSVNVTFRNLRAREEATSAPSTNLSASDETQTTLEHGYHAPINPKDNRSASATP